MLINRIEQAIEDYKKEHNREPVYVILPDEQYGELRKMFSENLRHVREMYCKTESQYPPQYRKKDILDKITSESGESVQFGIKYKNIDFIKASTCIVFDNEKYKDIETPMLSMCCMSVKSEGKQE